MCIYRMWTKTTRTRSYVLPNPFALLSENSTARRGINNNYLKSGKASWPFGGATDSVVLPPLGAVWD